MREVATASSELPGGLTVGDTRYFCVASETFDDGDKLMYGELGEVMGPPTLAGTKGKGLEHYSGEAVDMMFPGNKGNIACFPTLLSREPPPPLPGGHTVGGMVYSKFSETFPSGNKVVYGQLGEVLGPTTDHPDRVDMKFPGNKAKVGCLLTHLSREPPSMTSQQREELARREAEVTAMREAAARWQSTLTKLHDQRLRDVS